MTAITWWKRMGMGRRIEASVGGGHCVPGASLHSPMRCLVWQRTDFRLTCLPFDWQPVYVLFNTGCWLDQAMI